MPTESQPVVYVYRQPGHFGKLVKCAIYLDDKKVASLSQNGVTWFYVTPGNHKIGFAWGVAGRSQVDIEDNFIAGEYYIRLSSPWTFLGGSKIKIDGVPKWFALEELAKFKYEAPLEVWPKPPEKN